ncbi:STAS domain-containing protein [Streptomyces sp. NPDC018057]|uniref:STAS domain-containing protein n=1 Tax=unclassified Streptomyces TaxID=2593676 RepID=UPI0037A1494B
MTHIPSPCRVRDVPGRGTLFVLPPEIDLSNAPALCAGVLAHAAARAARLRLLVLDLTQTEFMDSQGARLVLDVLHRLPPHIRLRVAAAPHGIPRRVLEVTGVRRDVPVYDDPEQALRT